MPSPAAGRVSEVLVEVGTTVSVGTVLARIATGAQPGEAAAGEAREAAAEQPAAERVPGGTQATTQAEAATAPDPEPAPAAVPPQRPGPREPGARRRYSPVVTRMAAEHDIDLSAIRGTGRGGRVRKQDVLAHLANGDSGAPAAPEPPLHIESPYRPEPPAAAPAAPAPEARPAPSEPPPAAGRCRACAGRSAST